MRSEFESARRDYPNNGGTMMWMFNDCWPTSNWSIIDYTKNPKPCYYAAKRACAPVLPIIFERSGVVEFLVSNHSMRTPGVAAVWGGQRFDGQVLWSENSTARVKAGENAWFSRIKKTELNPDADYLFLDLSVDGEQKTRVIYFVQPWNSIKLPEPQYRTRIDRLDDRTLSIEVAALSFVRLFHILYTDDSNRPTLEDNYFDLSAGASRCIRVYFERCPDPASIRFGHWFTQWE
jgi:beta-mannosidase